MRSRPAPRRRRRWRRPCEATSAASAATAIRAGSATVVPKPRQNAKPSSAVALPLWANACAIDSPSGKRPLCSPWMKSVNPAITQSSPTMTPPRFGNGCCSTTIWKNAMTRMIGARSRSASAIRRTSTDTAPVTAPPSWPPPWILAEQTGQRPRHPPAPAAVPSGIPQLRRLALSVPEPEPAPQGRAGGPHRPVGLRPGAHPARIESPECSTVRRPPVPAAPVPTFVPAGPVEGRNPSEPLPETFVTSET